MKPSFYVGWGGQTQFVTPDMQLGVGSFRGLPQYGIRRAVWDAAYGYVSGFRKRHIIYYILTRSLNRHVSDWTMRREGVEFNDGVPVAKVVSR